MAGNLLIFGAGASYGSDVKGTPPLTKDLFDELALFNPQGWGQLSSPYPAFYREDFENAMRKLSVENAHALPPLQRAMAAYFFNFVPNQSNLYIKLADLIRKTKWKGALATLNYERLLELSLSHMGIQPYVGSTPDGYNKIELCLPHGCCHLFCESVRGNSRAVSMAGLNVSTRGEVKIISNHHEFNKRVSEDAFPPVMSYFESEKRTTSGYNFIVDQRNRFAELVSQSSVIGIVGLRVRPHDTHIWDSIALSNASIVYCSGESSGLEFCEWVGERRIEKENIVLPNYFSEGFDELLSFCGFG